MKKIRVYSSYFDYLIGSEDIIVPSKQGGFKIDKAGKFIEKPPSKVVKEFEKIMKTKVIPHFKDKFVYYGDHWPIKDLLFVYIEMGFHKNDFKERDCDNTAKAVLDSMKKTIFDDDSQVVSLIVQKCIAKTPYLVVGIKKRRNDTIQAVPFPELFRYRHVQDESEP